MNRLEKQREAQRRRAQAEAPAAQPVQPPKPPPEEPKRKFPLPRLPDGATFSAVWSESAQKWSASLKAGEDVFHAEARSAFTMLSRLDRFYRKSLGDKS
jgi:hypothetical protein